MTLVLLPHGSSALSHGMGLPDLQEAGWPDHGSPLRVGVSRGSADQLAGKGQIGFDLPGLTER